MEAQRTLEFKDHLPGLYLVRLKSDGEIVFLNILSAIPKEQLPQKLDSLRDIWLEGSPLTYDFFIEELKRHNIINGCELRLKARHVKGCYLFLSESNIVKRDLDMVSVYRSFAGTFKLKFSGARSLQAIPNMDSDQQIFRDIFSLFVCSPNEVKPNDKNSSNTDL
jgi:hypothetical protein